ncbi:MAG: hypothetical protein FWF85_02315, partial [Clostridiales bacterium]|nr:hypothetical protein [Clostridiales bacterium]
MKMNKTKKQLVTLFTMVFILLCLAIGSSALEGVLASDKVAELTGKYYDLDEFDEIAIKDGKRMEYDDPEQTLLNKDKDGNLITSAFINYSKSARDGENPNEFEIELKVETIDDIRNILVYYPASVVLVLDVSSSMDFMVDTNALGGEIKPGDSGWDISGTRWNVMKETIKDFIEKLLRNSNNQVSIVVYGGSTIMVSPNGAGTPGTIEDGIDHKTICNWTNNILTAISSFDKYEIVSTEYESYRSVVSTNALRRDVFGDMWNVYGATNCQAGFRGAIGQLRDGTRKIVNDPFVLYLSDGKASGSYEDRLVLTEPVSARNAITEAGKLKSEFSNCTLYTVGLSQDAIGSIVLQKDPDPAVGNPYVDDYFPAENAKDLSIVYETLLKEIYELSQAWMVTDPMSDYVSLDVGSIGVKDPYPNSFSVSGDTVIWDLINSEFKVEDRGGITVRVYTLTYTINVADPDSLEDYKIYPTNKRTSLSYVFLGNDLKPILPPQIDYFRIPGFAILKPKAEIEKVANKDKVFVGDEIIYTITLKNDYEATDVWKDVKIVDVIPDGLDYISCDADSGKVVRSGQEVTINWGDIDIGETVVINITVKVLSHPSGDRYLNTAVASSGNYDDIEDSVEVYPKTDGSISKVADPDAVKVRVGDTYSYTFTIANSDEATEAWKNV